MNKWIFYIALFLLTLIFSVNSTAYDNDLWARLIAGMGVIDGGHVLTQDFLSYTPVHTWWDHEWGAGVIFYAFLKYLGPFSLIILQAVMLFSIFFTISKILKTKSYSIVFFFFALMSVMPTLNNPIRCHLFSFLLFTVFIYILEKARNGSPKLLILIPFITLLWGNIHGGVISGLGLLVLYTIGEFLNKKPFKLYIYTLVISFSTLFINPWGIDYVKFLLMANTMPRPYIIEWWGIFSKFHLYKYIAFKLFIIFSILTETVFIYKTYKKYSLKEFWGNIDKTKYIILLATLYLAIIHLKLIPFFAICATCFIYDDFYKLIENFKFPTWKDKLIYAIIFVVSALNFVIKDFSIPVGISKYPIKEVEFIKINNIKGKLLTNFGYGSYASYKLYPNNTIFMDGRYEEVYPDYMVPILKEFFLNTNPQYIMDNFKPDVMIIEHKYPIYEALKQNKDWIAAYKGKNFTVFLPTEYKGKTFKQPTEDILYYKNTLFDTDIKF